MYLRAMREIKDEKAKQYIAAAVLAISAAALIEWLFIYGVMKPNFGVTEHPWRFFGAIISSLSGMLLFSVPILMRNEFDEDKKTALILGLGVALLFGLNDLLFYALIDPNPVLNEYLAWVLLEFLQFGVMGFAYTEAMASAKIAKFINEL